MTVLPNFNTCESHQQPAGHKVQRQQTYLGSNQHLSNGSTTYPTINILPSTENLANCSLLVKSWLLKETPKPLIYQASIYQEALVKVKVELTVEVAYSRKP